jgi:hypothetical protein
MTNLTNAALTRSLNFEFRDCCLDVSKFIPNSSVILQYIPYLQVGHCNLHILIERATDMRWRKILIFDTFAKVGCGLTASVVDPRRSDQP